MLSNVFDLAKKSAKLDDIKTSEVSSDNSEKRITRNIILNLNLAYEYARLVRCKGRDFDLSVIEKCGVTWQKNLQT